MILSTTGLTWILIAFVLIFIVPVMVYVQFLGVTNPRDQKTKNTIIGKTNIGETRHSYVLLMGVAGPIWPGGYPC